MRMRMRLGMGMRESDPIHLVGSCVAIGTSNAVVGVVFFFFFFV